MIQLKVYDDAGNQFFLDTYENSPFKINLSIEDIVTTATTSDFSRAFRVPANNHNAGFFKTAFEIEDLDFNVTVKKPAEVLVGGNQFRKGHIRLQKIYRNGVTGQIDYEILFLGETRDFSSIIGDSKMCELQISSLTHDFDAQAIIDSWEAYPATGTNGLSGLVNGNVIYPLIDFGNTYDSNGCVEQTRIATNHTAQGSCSGNRFFTNNSAGQHATNGVDYTRFKPMIRAKRLWDSIFDRTGFTYTSNFLGTQGDNDEVGLFKSLYVSAFGNDETITVDPALGSSDLFEASSSRLQGNGIAEFNIEIDDPGNNYNPTTYKYTVPNTAPAPGSPTGASFTFEAEVYVDCDFGGGTGGGGTVDQYQIYLRKNGTIAIDPNLGPIMSVCDDCGPLNISGTVEVFAGDVIDVYVDLCSSGNGNNGVTPEYFKCTSASTGQFNPTQYLDCEYKQIDFIKDVLTSFRLVMQPNPDKDNDFIIEPYNDFIASGEVLDWSDKLDMSKDLQIEPLFFTQADEIDFNLEEDTDQINDYHQKVWKETYGYLEFDSNSELLKGKRDIKLNYAPTPMGTIDGAPNNSKWVIPKIRTVEAEDQGPQHLPIKAKTRFLFYNGPRINDAAGTEWFWTTSTNNGPLNTPQGPMSYYGQVSPISGSALTPSTQADLILQWYKDVVYYVPSLASGSAPYTNWEGSTLYETYWFTYIQSLYASQARRVTGYFILDELDLYDFTFDKVIFVNGVYYTVEKVVDAQVGETASTKVVLTKQLNYSPPVNRTRQIGLQPEQTTESLACTSPTFPITVAEYTGFLQVGTQLTGIAVTNNPGYFKINQSGTNEQQYVGDVLQVSNAGVVLQILSNCP